MFCPRCGNKLHAVVTICPHCKYELDSDDIMELEEEEAKKKIPQQADVIE